MRRITSYYFPWHYYVLHFAPLFGHEFTITTYYYNTSLLHCVNYYVLLYITTNLLRITFLGNLQKLEIPIQVLPRLSLTATILDG
jgi:hypothetical protein